MKLSTCCNAEAIESLYRDKAIVGGSKLMYQCSKCKLACNVLSPETDCQRCDAGKRLECSEPCLKFTTAHEHACPDCSRQRIVPPGKIVLPPAPAAPVPFPMAELTKPKVLVLIESHDSKHYVQIKLDRLQYERLELMLGVDQDSINRLIGEAKEGVVDLPLVLGDEAVPGRYFDRMATFYKLG